MAVPPSVSNRKWWLGQLSPHSQPLCRSSFSQHSPSLCSRSPEPPHPSQLSPGNSWTELSSHWLHHHSSLGLSGEYALHLPSISSLFVFMCTQMCVCVRAGDTRCKNSWITEAKQDFWTALEQMVDELDQGIKTPEIENASVADGWDCGIVSWGLGAWALLCSLFSPSLCHRRSLSLTSSLLSIPDSILQAPTHPWTTHADVTMNTLGGFACLTTSYNIHYFVECLVCGKSDLFLETGRG